MVVIVAVLEVVGVAGDEAVALAVKVEVTLGETEFFKHLLVWRVICVVIAEGVV